MRALPLVLLPLLLTVAACGDDDDDSAAGGSAGAAGTGQAGSAQAGQAGQAGGGQGGAAGAGAAGSAGSGGTIVVPPPSQVDLLVMVDNSASMADKQKVLARALPELMNRLIDPLCQRAEADGSFTRQPATDGVCAAGFQREFVPFRDIHVAVVTSSLGGHGADYCEPGAGSTYNETQNDHARPITRRLTGAVGSYDKVETYQGAGFLAWDPEQTQSPPGEGDPSQLFASFSSLIEGADQRGCGFESSLEAWYRFLIDPNPPATVSRDDSAPAGSPLPARVEGTDELLLQQRARFLRPDSLVMIVNLSDENDCSIIDGAMPPDVCETPALDADGKPTGCQGARRPWPANYARGNFQGYTETDGLVTGTPFPLNQLTAQVGPLDPSQPGTFTLDSGTAACLTSPDSPACQSCYVPGTGQGCTTLASNQTLGDPPNLRCWNQKQRFGVDMLYPLQRYIDGLQNDRVYDRDGYLVRNPLYDRQSDGFLRSPQRVVYMPIVGVPWQDIARDPADLRKGYKPVVASGADPVSIDFGLILGNPLGYGGAPRVDPLDPLMIESNVGDRREGKKHPITGETISDTTWNSINGHEWNSEPGDLRYACIFDLAPDQDTQTFGDCIEGFDLPQSRNPLCERPTSPTDTKGNGTYDDPPRQYRAKAYPGTRFLQVARSAQVTTVVGSICTPNLTDSGRDDYGFRPAVSALFERVGPLLK